MSASSIAPLRRCAFLLVVLAVVSAPSALGQTETGLGPAPVYSHFGPGADFVAAGVTTRVQGTLPGVPPQTEPFALFTPAPPFGGLLRRVFVSWNWLLDGAPPATDTIMVNGFPVVGTLCGSGSPSLVNGKAGAASYFASLDPNFGPINHSVPNTIAGATDKALGTDPSAIGAGLTIACVYSFDVTSFAPLRSVDVYCGYTSTASNPATPGTAEVTMDFSAAYDGGPVHLLLNAIDGQVSADEFRVNGLLASALVLGTVSTFDAWQGLLGPSPSGVDNLYDHADDPDIFEFMSVGATSLTASTTASPDTIAHSFGIVSVTTAQPFLFWSPGKPDGVGLLPVLTGTGPLTAGSTNNQLRLTNGQQNLSAVLILGLASLRAPLFGGVFGPTPDVVVPGLVTSGTGDIVIPLSIPAGTPAGLELWTQIWIANPTATFGLSASNTLKLITQ